MNKIPSLRFRGQEIPLWVVGLAFVVFSLAAYAPYLNSGFSGDDFMFINMLEGGIPYDPLLGFWFGDIDAYEGFISLWWMEPGISGSFLRPLASWTLTLLYQLFGRNAVPYHALLSILHGLSAFTAFLILRRLSGRNVPSLLAAGLFLICEDHGMTVAWITTITDLLCVFFLNLAFLLHLKARQMANLGAYLLSLLFWLAALFCKETAVIYPAIIILYEFIFAGKLDKESQPVNLGNRLRLFLKHWPSWVIHIIIFASYMLLYRRILPPMRNLMYWDPFSEPLVYLGKMLLNLPVMFVGLLTQFLPSLAILMPETLPFVAGGGVVLLILLLWALRPYQQERTVWFSLIVFVLALLPGLAAEVGERLLYYPSVFGLFVVAWLIVQIPRLHQRFTPNAPPGIRLLGPVWGWYLLLSTAVLPLILLFIYPSMWLPGLRLPEQTILESLPLIEEGQHHHVVYLNTNSSYNTFYLPDIYRYHRGDYIDLRLLSSFNGRVSARQESENTIVLQTEDPGWLNNMFARIVRLTPGFAVGNVYETPLFMATVTAVTPDKQDVLTVRFEFILPLDDPSLTLLFYDGETFQTWQPTPDWQLLNPTLDPFGF